MAQLVTGLDQRSLAELNGLGQLPGMSALQHQAAQQAQCEQPKQRGLRHPGMQSILQMLFTLGLQFSLDFHFLQAQFLPGIVQVLLEIVGGDGLFVARDGSADLDEMLDPVLPLISAALGQQQLSQHAMLVSQQPHLAEIGQRLKQ